MPDPSGRRGVAIVAATKRGTILGVELRAVLDRDAELLVPRRWVDLVNGPVATYEGTLRTPVATLFESSEVLIMMLSTGATVRLLAPLLSDKREDPAVLVVDEAARHVISLLGGHRAGANEWAARVADALGAEAVVTTASEIAGLPPPDMLGADRGWRLESPPAVVTRVSAAAVNGEPIAIYQDAGERDWLADAPPEWNHCESFEALAELDGWAIVISDRLPSPEYATLADRWLVYRPPSLALGVGCSSGVTSEELSQHVRDTLDRSGLSVESVGAIGTIDRRADEPALTALAARLGAPLRAFSADSLSRVPDMPNPSEQVARFVGTPSVCEPAAVLASDGGELVVAKQRAATCTVAVARRRIVPRTARGRLSVVGLGPGSLDLMTPRARRALRDAQHIVGYDRYIDSIRALIPARRLHPYGLGQETERARRAVKLAANGWRVALVSSGDAGVYGMAGPALQVARESQEQIGHHAGEFDIEVVPGVTAASAAAALLGAPLMLDFAIISLSDLLIPWSVIEARIAAAADADFVVVVYNPASARRRRQFRRAQQIMLEHRAESTPCGVVRDAYRDEQTVEIVDLASLHRTRIDMRTVVVVGNSTTVVRDGRLITPRGYESEATRANA